MLIATVLTAVHLLITAATDSAEFEPFGLIHAVPFTFYLAVLANMVALAVLLAHRIERTRLLGFCVVLLTVTLHGTALVLQPVARFPTAWLHAGYTEHVISHGDVLTDLGARFSWPGFFQLTATAFSTEVLVPEQVLHWAPLVFALLYLPPLLVIFRSCGLRWRTAWIAMAIFPLINWVGQDYFAPQSFGFLLGLVIIALVLTFFAQPARLWAPSNGLFRKGGLFRPVLQPPDNKLPVAAYVLVSATVVVLALALMFSHQLTPYVVTLQMGVLWLVRRGRAFLVALAVGLIALVWLSWGAADFWVPWFNDLFGAFGRPREVIDAALIERTDGNAAHSAVVNTRLVFTLVIWLVALVGLVREWRAHRAFEPSAPLLLVTPFVLIVVQSYGGEGLLRMFLFSSPFVAIMIAKAFAPGRAVARSALATLVIVTLLASPVFLVARYGNESFERVTQDEVDLATCMYDAAPTDSTLAAMSPHLAWQFRDIADHEHIYGNGAGVRFDTDAADMVNQLAEMDGERFLIVTEPQLRFVERSLQGVPTGWANETRRELAQDSRLTPVCVNPAGTVYQFDDHQFDVGE